MGISVEFSFRSVCNCGVIQFHYLSVIVPAMIPKHIIYLFYLLTNIERSSSDNLSCSALNSSSFDRAVFRIESSVTISSIEIPNFNAIAVLQTRSFLRDCMFVSVMFDPNPIPMTLFRTTVEYGRASSNERDGTGISNRRLLYLP